MTSAWSPRLRRTHRRLAALAVMATPLLSACDSSGPTVHEVRGEENSSWLQACAALEQQSGSLWSRARCGRLEVPENPQQSPGRRIALNVIRLPAIASSPRPDPLFILVGGPGEAATDLVDRLPSLFHRVNQDRDIVLVDQRGTGQSNPLDCAAGEAPDYSLSAREIFTLQADLLRRCLAAYEADLRFYTTPYAADDLDQVRSALGYRRINLWGGSYGTRAALVYMRRHPDAVRSAVLDSVAPVDIRLPHHALVDVDGALRRLFDHCAREKSCRARFGNLESRARSLIAELDRAPRLVEMEHPLSQEIMEVRVSGQLVASLIRLGLYQRDFGPVIPLAIDSAAKGDFRPLALLLIGTEDVSESISLGMQTTILCTEDFSAENPKAENLSRPRSPTADVNNSILQLELVTPLRNTCDFWPEGNLPEGYFEPVRSNAPVLLVSGELDPVTPPRWAERAAETLPNSRHIRVPGAHHIASHVGCVDELITEFIATADPAELDAACVERIKPFPPFLGSAGPSMMNSAGPSMTRPAMTESSEAKPDD